MPRYSCNLTWNLASLALIPLSQISVQSAEPNRTSPPTNREAFEASFRNDAALADVFFADASTGWAVGDRGVIWHTADGGASWRQQHSGVTCRLTSVWFVDQRRGWAVGGASRAAGNTTQGIVLRSADGGETWQRVPALPLPSLNRVKFFDANVGVAIGNCSPAQPSGVFVTADGGQSWHAFAADQAANWLTGDFVDAETGAVAGSAGQFAAVARRQVIHSTLGIPSLRSAHAMRLVAPAGGWLVGDGGLVMSTRDLGHSWQSPPTELPNNAGDHFDLHAIAVHGPHVWIAGSPGTRVFHSPDGGKTWNAWGTGLLTPLRAMSFVDELHGWAVGDLGQILATSDGGQTWRLQRAGAQRAALLAVFAAAADVPLELIAELGAAECYVTAVDILHNMPEKNQRSRKALLLAGAAAADTTWRFPLPPDDLALRTNDLVAELNRATDGRAVELLQHHLVVQLRMWRPEVVVTHLAAPQSSHGIAPLLEQLLTSAVQAAADPTQFAALAADAGLQPWQVKKVYGLLPPGARGDEAIATSRFSPWLGASLADWVAPARRLLFDAHPSPSDALEFRLFTGEVAAATGGNGLFAGISVSHGSNARREVPDLPLNDLENVRQLATHRKHLQKLLVRSEGNAAWAAQIATLADGLDANAAAELMSQLAAGYCEAGRLDLAADTYYLLARRHPDHDLAEPALQWLVQFYASSEAAHRSSPRNLTNVRASAGDDEPAGGRAHVSEPSPDEPITQANAIAPIGQDTAPAIGLTRDDRLRRAAQLAEYLKSTRPALYAEPAIRFAEVAAQRQLGYSNDAKRYFLTFGQHAKNDAWRRCAETEQWLAKPDGAPPPKALAACRRTVERPHLDGQLDEPFWSSADRLRLSANESNLRSPTPVATGEVRLTYDNEFLYLAISSPKATGEYPSDPSPRPRDADLRQHDRIALRFDLDRDYSTAFEFSVDHRGRTHDACWGDVNWAPNWYVAAASNDMAWTVEAAIPVNELTADPPGAKHVWAVGVRRTIPRVGYQTWPPDAGAENSPDQYGLLIFE